MKKEEPVVGRLPTIVCETLSLSANNVKRYDGAVMLEFLQELEVLTVCTAVAATPTGATRSEVAFVIYALCGALFSSLWRLPNKDRAQVSLCCSTRLC